MRIVGVTVNRNESKRYLQSCLRWHRSMLDGMFMFDDRSTDDSREVARAEGCLVVERHWGTPAFMEHEGRFRQASLEEAERQLKLEQGDWILAFDTDEFLVGQNRAVLEHVVQAAERAGAWSVRIRRPEIWRVNEDGVEQRCDGWWGSITCTRLFRWRHGGQITDKPMGCGSEPTYIYQFPICDSSDGLFLLHYGYADAMDMMEKYQRYSQLSEHGHNEAHIASIIAKPILEPWKGPVPQVWRGVTAGI